MSHTAARGCHSCFSPDRHTSDPNPALTPTAPCSRSASQPWAPFSLSSLQCQVRSRRDFESGEIRRPSRGPQITGGGVTPPRPGVFGASRREKGTPRESCQGSRWENCWERSWEKLRSRPGAQTGRCPGSRGRCSNGLRKDGSTADSGLPR